MPPGEDEAEADEDDSDLSDAPSWDELEKDAARKDRTNPEVEEDDRKAARKRKR